MKSISVALIAAISIFANASTIIWVADPIPSFDDYVNQKVVDAEQKVRSEVNNAMNEEIRALKRMGYDDSSTKVAEVRQRYSQIMASSLTGAKTRARQQAIDEYAEMLRNPPGHYAIADSVALEPQGGSGGTSAVLAIRGSSMPTISVPTKANYTFKGYYSSMNGGGTQYYTAYGTSAHIWDQSSDKTLYAKWVAQTYTIIFDNDGGFEGPSSVTATYRSAMPTITPPMRTGYVFGGYFTEPNGRGTQYYTDDGKSSRVWDIAKTTTLYAKWTGNNYTVTFDKQAGSGGTDSVSATYGSSMPDITAPHRADFMFGGYFTEPSGVGTQYYTTACASARKWEEASATTLYANWTEIAPFPVHRFYSKAYKGHFFTINEAEKEDLISHNPNWKYEGVAYQAYPGKVPGTVELYRFYSKGYRGHFFTIDADEAESVKQNRNWKYEGIAYYVYPEEIEGSVPVFRFWSKRYRHHFYTTDVAEKDNLIATNPNWKYEGIAFYALPADDTGNSAKGAGRAAAGRVAVGVGEGQGVGVGVGQGVGVGVGVGERTGEIAAPWTLTLRQPCPGRVLAVPDVADLGEVAVETSDGVAAPLAIFAAAANAGADGAEDAAELRLALPDGVFTAQLWDGAGTLLEEQEAENTLDFSLPASGVWHCLVVLDADGEEAFSVWLRAEGSPH